MRVASQPQGEIPLEGVPGQAPQFAYVVHISLRISGSLAEGQRHGGLARLFAQLRPVDQAQTAIHVFHQGGTALHPVAVVAVQNSVDVAHFRAMDMSADHGVHAALARRLGHGVFEAADVLNRSLRLVLQVGG